MHNRKKVTVDTMMKLRRILQNSPDVVYIGERPGISIPHNFEGLRKDRANIGDYANRILEEMKTPLGLFFNGATIYISPTSHTQASDALTMGEYMSYVTGIIRHAEVEPSLTYNPVDNINGTFYFGSAVVKGWEFTSEHLTHRRRHKENGDVVLRILPTQEYLKHALTVKQVHIEHIPKYLARKYCVQQIEEVQK